MGCGSVVRFIVFHLEDCRFNRLRIFLFSNKNVISQSIKRERPDYQTRLSLLNKHIRLFLDVTSQVMKYQGFLFCKKPQTVLLIYIYLHRIRLKHHKFDYQNYFMKMTNMLLNLPIYSSIILILIK